MKESSITNLGKLIIKFDKSEESKIFKYFLEKQKNIAFQEFFERTIPIIPILPQFYYQYHFFYKN